MKFYEKLIQLRREKGYSQEQLADLMGVSRQAVSKWEAGQSMPDLPKLIQLSDLFQVTVDMLVRDQEPLTEGAKQPVPASISCRNYGGYEYRSKRTIFGLPLIHINCGCGFRVAKGILAVGDLSIGVISFGGLALGGLCFGGGSIGLLALGGIALGGLSLGGLSIGAFALGGCAVGVYALGGSAIASQIAVGANAIGHTAIGVTARGTNVLLEADGLTRQAVESFLQQAHPNLWTPLLRLFAFLFPIA